jgi:hypothetical protein
MRKEGLKDLCREHNLNFDLVLADVWEFLKKHSSSWQSLSSKIDTTKPDPINIEKLVSYGYRKYSTGQYVPKKYLSHFGWKNTYYQKAITEISINPNFYRRTRRRTEKVSQ